MDSYQVIFWALVAIILLYYVRMRSQWIGLEEAKELLAQGAILIDVRTPREFQSGHIAGAKNIPLYEILARQEEMGALDQPILLYCQSGTRSHQAVRMLRRKGFTQVHNVGSIARWH